MDYILDYNNIKKLPEQSLAVTQCGLQKCLGAHKAPPRLYHYYSVAFILSGKGAYTSNGKTFELRAGQGFLIRPGVLTSYVSDSDDPWHYIYAMFRGSDSEALIRNAGFSDGKVIFDFTLDTEMKKDLYSMYECSRSNEALGYDVTGHFLLIMSRLIKIASQKIRSRNPSESYLRRALSYIEDHYPYNISIQDIANAVSIDRTYLYKLFKAHIGLSPIEVLNNRRLERAKELLAGTDISVSEIALSTGFYDLSHFNRVFSGNFGITPGQYRKELLKLLKK